VTEDDTRRRRLAMRAARRGTREMDLILGRFAQARLPAMPPAALDRFEALLDEADPDLFAWVLGTAPPPGRHAALVAEIAAFARGALRAS